MICFYLLPALAAILKTRKRKLAQISPNSDSALTVNSNFSTIVKSSFETINLKLSSLASADNGLSSTSSINKNLNVYLAVVLPSTSLFNISILKQAQISYFLYA